MSLSKDQNPFKMCKICEEVTTMIVHKIIKDCLAALGLKQNKKKRKKKDQHKYNFFCFETRLDGSLVEAGLLEIVHYCFLGFCSVSVQVIAITPI